MRIQINLLTKKLQTLETLNVQLQEQVNNAAQREHDLLNSIAPQYKPAEFGLPFQLICKITEFEEKS